MAIRAVTFDLWDTVIIDESDEPKRAEMGLLPKPEQRRQLVWDFLNRQAPISKETVNLAYDVTDAAFGHVWYGQNVTWEVPERLSVLLKGLKRELPDDDLAELVRLHEDMELEVQPDLAKGIVDAVRELSRTYKLAVISDTLFSPGRVLRRLLAGNNILDCFSSFAFSDEVGCSKPAPKAFHAVAEDLGIDLSEIVHIGDRERKDVDGAHHVGAKAIYTSVIKDRGSAETKAEALCTDYKDLVSIVNSLNT
jgi:HAD superfamily hydrolase (TIGR01549 family)